MLLRLTEVFYNGAGTDSPFQSFDISPCSMLTWNSLHTVPAMMPTYGLMMVK